jgi:hypothetical protein
MPDYSNTILAIYQVHPKVTSKVEERNGIQNCHTMSGQEYKNIVSIAHGNMIGNRAEYI